MVDVSTLDARSAIPELGDNVRLDRGARSLFRIAGGVGILFWGASLIGGILLGDQLKQFLHSYLVAYMWTLSICLGALFWVTLQHLVNAKWSIVVRRVGELLAANIVWMAVLAGPIVVPVLMGNDSLYLWADAQNMHQSHLLHHKAPYLNVTFFTIRCVVYFCFWAALARYFLSRSLRQDRTGDPELVRSMRRVSAPAMIALAVTLTFAAIDFLMTLCPEWFSTIFGVYYFAGCVVSAHAVFALALMWLQQRGSLTRSVSVEHYHDIGKMMFAFVVFWSYVAFSQYMLIWYANVPEETHWYHVRFTGSWPWVGWALVFGHFLIPFFGLLSRHVKRHRTALAAWAAWLLVIHWIDMYWLVMPHLNDTELPFHWLDVTCLCGLAALYFAAFAYQASRVDLIPIRDPRLRRSLAFQNI